MRNGPISTVNVPLKFFLNKKNEFNGIYSNKIYLTATHSVNAEHIFLND